MNYKCPECEMIFKHLGSIGLDGSTDDCVACPVCGTDCQDYKEDQSLFQLFESEEYNTQLRIQGIDEVPEESKTLATMYLINAVHLVQGAIRGKVGWRELLTEQTNVSKAMKDIKKIALKDTWVSPEQIVDELLKDLKKEEE